MPAGIQPGDDRVNNARRDLRRIPSCICTGSCGRASEAPGGVVVMRIVCGIATHAARILCALPRACPAMHTPDHEFDPDDNYTGDAERAELDEDASAEALVWQLLLIINPGDEDAALQQFGAFQEALDGGDADDIDAVWLLKDVIDWKSGFHVDDTEPGALIDCIAELAARFNLTIDWGVEDATDEEFLARVKIDQLLEIAHDQLRLDGYTLWTWDTGTDAYAGWMTLSSDDEAMRVIAPALRIEVRTAGM